MTARAASSLGRIALAVGLCALPARGESALSPQILYALTSIDTLPTKQDLEVLLASPNNELVMLRDYALGPSFDFGMRLRAIRTLPHFCAQQMDQCRAAIHAVLDDQSGTTGQRILRHRAAIEALGAAKTGQGEDVDRVIGFLDHESRDVRVAAVRVLRDLCDPKAIDPLRARGAISTEVTQVRQAIIEALEVLEQCGP